MVNDEAVLGERNSRMPTSMPHPHQTYQRNNSAISDIGQPSFVTFLTIGYPISDQTKRPRPPHSQQPTRFCSNSVAPCKRPTAPASSGSDPKARARGDARGDSDYDFALFLNGLDRPFGRGRPARRAANRCHGCNRRVHPRHAVSGRRLG